jgi:heme exporter protein B
VNGLLVLFRRELALSWGKGGGPLLALAFYAAMATLLPLATGPAPARLAIVAPGSAWLALALASLLSLERLFERDYEDGALDLLALGPAPLEAVAFAKCLAQWITTGAPLALVAPIAAIAFGAEPRLAPLVVLTALIGGLGFSFCGGIGAALSIGSRRGGVLIAVIVLPLFAPPVIFGAGTIEAYAAGQDWKTGLMLLGAYSLATIGLGPFAMAAACRNALS